MPTNTNSIQSGLLLQFKIDERKKDVAIMPKAVPGNNADINTLLNLGAEFLNTDEGQCLCEELMAAIIDYARSRVEG